MGTHRASERLCPTVGQACEFHYMAMYKLIKLYTEGYLGVGAHTLEVAAPRRTRFRCRMVTSTDTLSMAGAKVVWSHGFSPRRAMLASHSAQLYTARSTMGVGLQCQRGAGAMRLTSDVTAGTACLEAAVQGEA